MVPFACAAKIGATLRLPAPKTLADLRVAAEFRRMRADQPADLVRRSQKRHANRVEDQLSAGFQRRGRQILGAHRNAERGELFRQPMAMNRR